MYLEICNKDNENGVADALLALLSCSARRAAVGRLCLGAARAPIPGG
jgi:hypothetical protein